MDYNLLLLINGFALKYAWLDYLGVFFAVCFQYFVVGAVLIWAVLKYRTDRKFSRRLALLPLAAAVVARFFIGTPMRYFFAKLRPFAAHPDTVKLLINYSQSGNSFPSGHTLFFFGFASAVFILNKKAGIACFVAAFLISLARVFVGVHYPVDILSGAVIGTVVGYVVTKISLRLRFFFE